MLEHVVEDKVEGACNPAAHSERRRELAQIWADMVMDGIPTADAEENLAAGTSVPGAA